MDENEVYQEDGDYGVGADDEDYCLNQGNSDGAVEDEEVQLSAEQMEAKRQDNIRSLLNNELQVTRKPMVAGLTVRNVDAVLRSTFVCPHPTSNGVPSDSLRKRLLARKRFVPWGGGKHDRTFAARISPKVPTPPSAEEEKAVEAKEELEGLEPLVLWTPPPSAAGPPVSVDPMLLRWLRPHQREGVQFMFECVAGLRDYGGNGCILADDMGLGKTLQGIALLWTLLRNGHELLGGSPLAKRVIICCPTSLVSNWDQECAKWLKGRVRTLPLCESSRDDVIQSIQQFLAPQNYFQVLIVSYETFRIHAERFKAPWACDLLICDEAHRLKNDATLTNKALDSLATRRRVLLSGTPLQNRLDEFYAMTSFVAPAAMGTAAEFRKRYEAAILAGREPGATDSEVALGEERSLELSATVNKFILRRTNALLSAHLPPKAIMVVCCKLTPVQRDLYRHFLQSALARSLLGGGGDNRKAAGVLSSITSLKKLCNHPKLIWDALHSAGKGGGRDGGAVDGFQVLPPWGRGLGCLGVLCLGLQVRPPCGRGSGL